MRPPHVSASRVCLAALSLVMVGLGPGASKAQVRTLPLPPPPPSSVRVLTTHLSAGLAGEGTPAPWSGKSIGLLVTLTTPPAESTPEVLQAFVADAIEVAMTELAAPRARVAPDEEAELTVEVELALTPDGLSGIARLIREPQTLWELLRQPQGGLIGTAFASVSIDLELRTLLGWGRRPVDLSRWRLVPVTRPSHASVTLAPVLDLAVWDADRDGQQELWVLQSRRLIVLRWRERDKGFSELVGTMDLARKNDAPRVRNPIGRLVPLPWHDGSRRMIVATSERGHAGLVALRDGALVEESAVGLSGLWPLYSHEPGRFVGVRWPAGTDLLAGEWIDATVADPSSRVTLGQAEGFYDLRVWPLQQASSEGWSPRWVHSQPRGSATVEGLDIQVTELAGVGPAAVLRDVDADGVAELLATSDRVTGGDELVLYRLASQGGSSATCVVVVEEGDPADDWRGGEPGVVVVMDEEDTGAVVAPEER